MTGLSHDMIERAARAICDEAGADPNRLTYAYEMKCTGHESGPKYVWEFWKPQAVAALTAALNGTHVMTPIADLSCVVEVADRNEFHPATSRIKALLKARPDNAPTSPTIPAFCGSCLNPLSENKP